MKNILRFAVLGSFSALALAASVPFTFTAGAPAVAAEVNANFTALANAITTLEAKVASLEGANALTAADVAGTYRLLAISSKATSSSADLTFGAGSQRANSILVISTDGTFTFNSEEASSGFSAKTTQCNSPGLSRTGSSGPSTTGSAGSHDHGYTYAACTSGGFVSTEPPISFSSSGTGAWSLTGQNTIRLTPAGEPGLTVYLAKGNRIGFGVETQNLNDGGGTGSRFEFDVFIKQ